MIILDSDFIIDFLRGKQNAVKFIEKNKISLATTEINIFEVSFGIYMKKNVSEKEIRIAHDFFASLDNVFPFDEKCGHISAKILTSLIKKGEEIEQNDCFIASIIIKNKCEGILTGNKKHFSKIKDVKVLSY